MADARGGIHVPSDPSVYNDDVIAKHTPESLFASTVVASQAPLVDDDLQPGEVWGRMSYEPEASGAQSHPHRDLFRMSGESNRFPGRRRRSLHDS